MNIGFFLLTISSFLTTTLSLAQNFTGIVVSRDSKIPLQYANVYFPGTEKQSYVGTYTDETGQFELLKPAFNKQDTLYISCIGFKTKKIITTGILPDTLSLDEAVSHLSDVVIKAKTAEEFLKECINKIPSNYKNAVFLNYGTGWIALKSEDKFEKLIESRVGIVQEYQWQALKTSLLFDSIHEISSDNSAKIIPEYSKLESYLYFDLIRSGPSILDTAYLNSWDIAFSYQDSTLTKGTIVLDALSKGKFNDYRLYINESDLGITKIEYAYNWGSKQPTRNVVSLSNGPSPHRSTDSLSYMIAGVQGVIFYEKTFDKYNLKYLSCKIDYRQVTNGNSLASLISFSDFTLFSEFYVVQSTKYKIGDKSIANDIKKPFKIPRVVPIRSKEYMSAKSSLQKRP
jgi:hypothetical protein